MKKSKSSKSVSKNSTAKKNGSEEFLVVGVGASAGGIQALKGFFENVSADSGLAFVVILHLSPDHESQLAPVLQTVSKIPVKQVTEKVLIEPNHVYVVPPSQSLKLLDGHIILEPVHTIEERRAPIDIFFRNLAELYEVRAVAVILSGTGADGSMGMKRVKEKGGVVFVQNPREAEYSDMPRNSIATDLVDAVLNVGDIPAKIVAYKDNFGAVEIAAQPQSRPELEQAALREIFTQLRVRTGHDFSNYKRPTVLRRIERRVNVSELPDLPAYARFLRESKSETQSLLKDLLISVTNFFRDKEAFAYLETDILPKITGNKGAGSQVRVWVAGCATGEEAYSIAMLLAESVRDRKDTPDIQIFASDIDEAAISKAREGLYTLNDVADVSPERLRRFFTKDSDGYRIQRELREMVLFANHNVIKDPPFSRLDLVTCRNMLIYLNHAAQERVMETMHFALNPGGFLFLGSSESIDGASDLYVTVKKEFNIFQSRQVSSRPIPVPDTSLSPSFNFNLTNNDGKTLQASQEQENKALERISFADLHLQMLERYSPPSIVVNENYDIMHLSERAGRFLQIMGGEPSNNLLKLVRQELTLELRAALYQALQKQTNVEAKNLQVRIDDRTETVNIHVRPVIRPGDTARGFFLVIFESALEQKEDRLEINSGSPDSISRHLEEELTHVKAQLRSSIEQYEVQTEELRASNEELQAINEELRSTGEELETSKEELQSINEELVTVNQELKIKIEELSQSNNDFRNLINSTDIGTIFLDRNFRVKLYTPAARELFNLIPADYGRPLSDITSRLENSDIVAIFETVLEKLQTVEREVHTVDGRTFLMQTSPYRTAEDRINGVVVAFVNITRRKQAEDLLKETAQSLEQQSRIFNTTLTGISDFAYIFDRDGRFVYSNKPLLDLLGVTAEEIVGKNFLDLNYPEDLAARLQKQIQQVFERGEVVRDETPFTGAEGKDGFYEYIFTPLLADDGTVESVVGSTRDVTERKRIENELRQNREHLQRAMEAGKIFSWELNLETREFSFSENMEAVLGFNLSTQIIQNPFESNMHPEDAEFAVEKTLHAVETGEPYQHTGRFINPQTGDIIWLHSHGGLMTTTDGRKVFAGIAQNITEQKRAEEALRESEERSRLLIEGATDFAIFRLSNENLIESWNTGAERVFGWKESEIIGQSGAVLFTPEDRANGVPEREKQTAAKKGRAEDERWHIRKDGSRFFASGVMTKLTESAEGFVKIARDQTDKIVAEKALREKEMLQKLVGAQEDERKRIARDLHDELGQQLTAIRLKLEATRKICEVGEICDKIDEIQLMAKQIDADVDFLAWELRPAALDDLGLIASLENYVREWSRHAGTTAEFHSPKSKKMRLAPEIEINLYRITQEALNNTHKHAEAKAVSIVLERRDDLIVLIIEDDGVGFNPKLKKNRSKGLGLMGMQERAALVGGTFEIESAPKHGTTVFVRVPALFVKKEKENV